MSAPDPHVLLLTSGSNLGGAETALARLVPRLRRCGIDARAAHVLGDGPARDYLAARGVASVNLGLAGGLHLPAGPTRLAALIERWSIDLVHAFGLRANLLARLVAPRFGARVVAGILSTDPWRSRIHTWADRLTSRRVDLWIANARACRDAAVARREAPRERVVVVPDGIDLTAYPAPAAAARRLAQRLGLPRDRPVLVVPASLREAKGHADLVEAAARTTSSCLFLCAGQDFLDGKIQRMARERGVLERFRFPGFVDELPALLMTATAVVLPSRWEGLPICLIEAMASGRPVVSTRVGGVEELVRHSEDGLLVPARDPEALASAIDRLFSEPGLLARLGRRARRRVEERHDAEISAARHAALYRMVLQDEKERLRAA